MTEYINREAAIRALLNDAPEQVSYSREDAADCIRYMDAADVAPVVHGYWIDNGANGYKWAFICSRCGYVDGHPFDDRHNFCPSCGARMDGGKNDAVD